MRNAQLTELKDLSNESASEFARAVRESTEAGMIVPSLLALKLSLTCDVKYEEGRHGVWTRLYLGNELVGQSFAPDKHEGILLAVLGKLREEK